MRRRVRHASRATRPSQPREQISTLDGFARSEETRGGDTPARPADPLDPRTSRLVSNRADAVLGSRLTDDAIWPTPSMPAKVRRDPLSAATFSARPAASALKTTTTRAVRAVDTVQKVPKRRFSSRVRLFATTLEPDAVGQDTRSRFFPTK
jgi:hypothetical protein